MPQRSSCPERVDGEHRMKITINSDGRMGARSVEESLRVLRKAVVGNAEAELSLDELIAMRDHSPRNLDDYHLGRIAAWALPRYATDRRFVNLTLLLDQGREAQERWMRQPERFDDLQKVLAKHRKYPALVVLGAPGGGKATLLRRLDQDTSIDSLRSGSKRISVYAPLNGFPLEKEGHPLPSPRQWLERRWAERYPELDPLSEHLDQGRVLLLLDGLNEIPHRGDYGKRVERWREFLRTVISGTNNRAVFTCRHMEWMRTFSP